MVAEAAMNQGPAAQHRYSCSVWPMQVRVYGGSGSSLLLLALCEQLLLNKGDGCGYSSVGGCDCNVDVGDQGWQ